MAQDDPPSELDLLAREFYEKLYGVKWPARRTDLPTVEQWAEQCRKGIKEAVTGLLTVR